MNKTKIGILGSGAVAKSLASGFINNDHDVMIGTRDLSKLKEWQSKNLEVKLGSFSEAASFGNIIVLAVKGTVAANALTMAEKQNLNGKIIIDGSSEDMD